MHITKTENGMYKVELKGFKCFYVEDFNTGLELALKMAGVKSAK